jgi:hypothetical protein
MDGVEKTDAPEGQASTTPPAVWPAGGWFEGHYAGRETFRQLLCEGLLAVTRTDVTELILSDPDFSDWPLDDPAVVQALHQWMLAGRPCKVTLLAASYDQVVRRHALFVRWRVQWAHKIECRRWREGNPLDLPSLLWTPQWAMRRDDLDRCTGQARCEPRWRVTMREHLQEWLRNSTAGFPASVLGL